MSAESTITQITDNAISTSNRLIEKAITYSDQAVSQSFLAFGGFTAPIINPDLLPVNIHNFDPTLDLRDSYKETFDRVNGALGDAIPDMLQNFMAKNFPSSKCWEELSGKLCDWLNADGVLTDAEEEKMRGQIKDRAYRLAKISASNAYHEAASKGNRVAPDWTFGAINDIYNEAARNIAEGDRDITVKLIQMRLDWLDKVIKNIVDMREKAVKFGLEYIDTVYKSAQAADRNASGYVGSYKNFYDSLNSYYGAVNSVNELKFKIAAKNADASLETTKSFVTATVGSLDTRVRAITELARSMGTLAGSATAGLNTLAVASNNTNITQG